MEISLLPDFSPSDVATWAGGEWTRDPLGQITSVHHDTRTVQKGSLYVALKGARVDGHDLIPQAIEQGAVGVLCKKGRAIEHPDAPCLEVEDVEAALGDVANGHRSRCQGHLIAITGSAGKTTVKDFLAAMCRAAGSTCSTPGNWNNFIGLPLSMLRMETTDAFGVFELGMNHAGEIRRLAKILEPDLGGITSIGEAHLEQLGSVLAIAQEKTSLFASLQSTGFCLVDMDSDWKDLMVAQAGCTFHTYSLYEDADLMGRAIPDQPEVLVIEDRVRGERWEIEVPLPGEHMRKNLLLAIGLARQVGVTPDQIRGGLNTYKGSPLRWEISKIGSLQIINDAYNANPLSMKCAIKAFAEQEDPLPAWVVLGEMAELGSSAQEFHTTLGRTIDSFGLEGMITVGAAGKWIAEGVEQTRIHVVNDVDEATDAVVDHVPDAARLLVKASRSVGLESLVDALNSRKNS